MQLRFDIPTETIFKKKRKKTTEEILLEAVGMFPPMEEMIKAWAVKTKTTLVALKGWNLDDIIKYIQIHGAQLEQDNNGDFLLYTGLSQDKHENLVRTEEI